MPFSDLPLPILVSLFLTLFVVLGIYPAMRRAAAKLRRLRRTAAQAKTPLAANYDNVHAELSGRAPAAGWLNDFEIIVLRRLARAGGKTLSRRQVNAPLHLGRANLDRTLHSLNRRELVQLHLSPLLGPRFSLTEAGRRYALEQGYIVPLHQASR